MHQIRSGEQIVSDFERDDLHREVLRTQGRLTERVGYDPLGRRTWQSAGSATDVLGPGQGRLWRSYRYDAAGELAEQRDNLRGATSYDYDPAGQLLRATREVDRTQEQFAWDAAGNLLDAVSRKSAGSIVGNRLHVWQDIRFTYDAWGNVATKRRGTNQTQTFRFDADNRLIAVTTQGARGTIETRFAYDALGRRIARHETQKEASGGTPHHDERCFVWQGLRLAQEIRHGGVSAYVYSPKAAYTPIARLDAGLSQEAAAAHVTDLAISAAAKSSTRVLHFHTDLVGAPLEVTDESGELAWAGRYKAWGAVERGEDAALLSRIEQPLRYPGQYADDSTGLHYNTFRYYDPDVGRFVNQDPIGLAGGENLYSYAPNATSWMDPLGWTGSDSLGEYDVHGEAKLPQEMYRMSDGRHFQEANRQLFYQMKNDPQFRAAVEAKYPGTFEAVSPGARGRFPRSAPTDLTWHHHEKVGGLLQLVDQADHNLRHKDYHPTGRGGRNTWGGGSGCR